MATAAVSLTPKQQNVVTLVREGKTVPQIAKKMKITPNGVYGHLRRIKDLGVDLDVKNGAPASTNGSSPNGKAGALAQIEALVKDAIGHAEARAEEISDRRGNIKIEMDQLKEEDAVLAAEGETLAARENGLTAALASS